MEAIWVGDGIISNFLMSQEHCLYVDMNNASLVYYQRDQAFTFLKKKQRLLFL